MTTSLENGSPAIAPAATSGGADGGSRVAELLEAYESLAASPARRGEPAALAALRREAAHRFRREGFPTSRLEAWRFTNPAPAARARTRIAPRRSLDQLDDAERRRLGDLRLPGCREVVVLDGHPVSGLDASPRDGAEAGSVRVRSLAADWRARQSIDGLGRLADPASPWAHAWSLLNAAFFEDGVLIEAAERGSAPEPIHLLHVVTGQVGGDEPIPAVYPRTLIRAGAGSQLVVIETYASLGDGSAVVSPVTELYCGPGAALRHYRVTRESAAVKHLASQHLQLERDASASSLLLSWGGELVRCDLHALLAGEGGDCRLDGLYVLGGRQHFDVHMRVEHAAPHCGSHELYKGVLDEAAHAVFDGRIYVHRSAQKTDAKQTNRNLLLSERAVANSNPQLEIFADDVKCTHGSTVGQLEPDALFYLRSRGIELEAARSLLTYAFASELLERITIPALREQAEAMLTERLARGAIVADVSPSGEGALSRPDAERAP